MIKKTQYFPILKPILFESTELLAIDKLEKENEEKIEKMKRITEMEEKIDEEWISTIETCLKSFEINNQIGLIDILRLRVLEAENKTILEPFIINLITTFSQLPFENIKNILLPLFRLTANSFLPFPEKLLENNIDKILMNFGIQFETFDHESKISYISALFNCVVFGVLKEEVGETFSKLIGDLLTISKEEEELTELLKLSGNLIILYKEGKQALLPTKPQLQRLSSSSSPTIREIISQILPLLEE